MGCEEMLRQAQHDIKSGDQKTERPRDQARGRAKRQNDERASGQADKRTKRRADKQTNDRTDKRQAGENGSGGYRTENRVAMGGGRKFC